jgi:putative transposase
LTVLSSRSMPDSFVANRVHCIFSTKERRKLIPESMQPRLWQFMAGIARTKGIQPIEVGGFDNHVHVLMVVPQTMPLAKAVQLIKAGSSKWCNQNLKNGRFEWQTGYSAFSVSASQLPATVAYIRNQKEHHRRRDFAQEWREFLKKNGFNPDVQ